MFCRCSLDVLRMFAGFFQDVFRMLRWVSWAWWNVHFNDSKELDDPWLFHVQSYLMIPSYSMIRSYLIYYGIFPNKAWILFTSKTIRFDWMIGFVYLSLS